MKKTRLIKDIWNKSKDCKLYSLIALLSALIALEVALTCAIPEWRKYFFNGLEKKNIDIFYQSMIYFIILMGSFGLVSGLKQWIGQLVSFRLRKSGTKILFKKWVKGSRTKENYSQAMTESLRNMTEGAVEVGIEVIIAASIVVILMINSVDKPMILLASMIFTVVVSILATVFNKPLINSNMMWQKHEGLFRETIGLVANDKGDYTFKDKLLKVSLAYRKYTLVLMNFTLFSKLKSSLSALVPYMLLSGSYFAGTITLGDFMNGVATFELIVLNATILLVLYPRLMQVRSSYKLTNDFYRSLHEHSVRSE